MYLIDKGAAAVLERLEQAGFEAYLVGGCVRDLLRGAQPHDWDITTSARPEEVQAVFSQNTVLTTGLRHGTVTVLLENTPYEVTTYRMDGAYSDGRRPDSVLFVDALESDLARRDFTINAMAMDGRGALRDPFGGQPDLNARLVRCVGDAERRFQEDGLRVMRALRFAACLDFSIQEETTAAIHRCRSHLSHVAGERIQAELFRLLTGPGAGQVLRAFPDVLTVFWPELEPMPHFDQRNPWHCWDLWEHTVRAVEAVPPELSLRLAALLHDAGKPSCFTVDDAGVGHFYGHPEHSAHLADTLLRRLHSPNALRETVVALIARHHWDMEPEERLLRRRLRQLGPEGVLDLLALQQADVQGQAPAVADQRCSVLRQTQALVQEILAKAPCLTLNDLAIGGREILALGVKPGPEVGRILTALLDRVAEEDLPNTQEALLPAAQTLLEQSNHISFCAQRS